MDRIENSSPPPSAAPAAPTFREALKIWFKIGCLSFGGPAGQIATMHRILVDEKKWIDEQRFLHALNYCTLLPGPEAQQLATYVGWLLHGTLGGYPQQPRHRGRAGGHYGGRGGRHSQSRRPVHAACAVPQNRGTALRPLALVFT
jgi:hypothetical protein